MKPGAGKDGSLRDLYPGSRLSKGWEQDFNSLDAQYDPSQAYIRTCWLDPAARQRPDISGLPLQGWPIGGAAGESAVVVPRTAPRT